MLMQNTASIVADRVRSIKAKNNDKEAVVELAEIINDLVDRNVQLQGLAQACKQELVAQQVAEEGIRYITDTLIPIVEELATVGEKPVSQPMLDMMKKPLSRETLGVMQLLRFNFKQAIGAPLTWLLSDRISSRSPAVIAENTQHNVLSLQLKMIELARDSASCK